MRAKLWGVYFFAMAGVLLVLTGVLDANAAPSAKPAVATDAIFYNTKGWLGADGDYSVSLSKNKVLWLFSDTFVGEIKDHKRVGASLINNSIAIQTLGLNPGISYYYGAKPDGAADAFIVPDDGKGYYWLFAGVRVSSGLYFFLMRVENTGEGGAFGFRTKGARMARVTNPDDAPPEWRIRQVEFPFGVFGDSGSMFLGSAILRDKNTIYIYGLDGRKHGKPAGMIVAKVEAREFGDFKQWRFLAGGEWQQDFLKSTVVCNAMPTEYSVSYLPGLKKYVATFTEGGIAGVISIRTAATPIGPWSAAERVYDCPDKKWHPRVFCYAAKAHPALAASPDELVISYAANSFDFSDLFEDARLYWPRFVRFKLSR